jgi:propanediol dehydratase small subunit
MDRVNYPLGEHRAAVLQARSGRPLAGITVASCMAGELGPDDIAIEAETLRLQAEIARGAGRPRLAENLERAAEMVALPAELIFAIYEKLRPGRARDATELREIAARLRAEHQVEKLAALVEEAAAAYADRKLFEPRFG